MRQADRYGLNVSPSCLKWYDSLHFAKFDAADHRLFYPMLSDIFGSLFHCVQELPESPLQTLRVDVVS